MGLEFRVRWQREGRNPSYRIYQDWNAACQKVQGLQAMDSIKAETERFADMPDLVSVELQVREVGAWGCHAYQPKVNESAIERVREALWYRYGEGAPKDRPTPSEMPF